MVKMFLGCHGRMASGMKKSLEILAGDAECLTVFDAYVDEENLQEHLDAFFEDTQGAELRLLLSDIYGGSVNQAMYQYLDRENTMLIAGINLPILLELVTLENCGILKKKDVFRIVEEARTGIQIVNLQDNDAEEPEADDFFGGESND